jgi:hypothetical protein
MTRTHAAYQLLRHGPLTLEQFRWITCWPTITECREVLDVLRKEKKVVLRQERGCRFYDIAKPRRCR